MTNPELKHCFKCDTDKPRSDFYTHPQMADGLLGKCKECTKRDTRIHYEVSGGRKEYEQTRSQTSQRKEYLSQASRKHRERNPERYKARTAVSNALRDGRLIKEPCFYCNGTERVQAHHHDYSKPLDVKWVCFKCHRENEHDQTTR
jgi:hypothetical protein